MAGGRSRRTREARRRTTSALRPPCTRSTSQRCGPRTEDRWREGNCWRRGSGHTPWTWRRAGG
ncbi:centriole, cilia and spindle associated protein [Phyllostomus discolor]|uniref:Centriole, cilia and spindle associated protein n=1 Tax=Phyllostomus discolor TaxID=89673 RepID=A0A833YHG2_9CHIR|nr:centriole, cilia and spindle associated protein [Phyllostomus discolor]